MLRKCALFAAAALVSALPLAAHVTIQCPAADTVVVHAIPHSVNSYFTAKSDGVEFGGFGAGWIPSFALLQASIVVSDGSFALRCNYGTRKFFETLESGTSANFQACSFPDGGKTCVGSLDQCALDCPEQPEDNAADFPHQSAAQPSR
ncbi:MAG: hypothetical protein AAF604_19160 [Acidobacteriota bacterium]